MATKTKWMIGIILVTLLASGIVYLQFSDFLKIRIDEDKSTFYAKNDNGRWVVAGRELNSLWDGTSKMNRDLSNTYVLHDINLVDNTSTITRHTTYQRGPVIKDTYFFDGKITDKELFPVKHTVEVFNASGFIYQYEVRDLVYDGLTIKDVSSPQSFGLNMKVEWQDGSYWNTLYKSGILKVRYRPQTDYEIYNVRLFDPPTITLDVQGYNASFNVELGSILTILANTSLDETICIDVDHPSYGVNYSCGTNSTTFDLNITSFQNSPLRDSEGSNTDLDSVTLTYGDPYTFQEDANSTSANVDGYIVYFNMNYTKSNDVSSAIWQVKHGGANASNAAKYNVSLPDSCVDAYDDDLVLRVKSYVAELPGEAYSQPQCDIGGSWIDVGKISYVSSFGIGGSFTNVTTLAFDGNYSTGLRSAGQNIVITGSRFQIDPPVGNPSYATYPILWGEAIYWKAESNQSFFIGSHMFDELVSILVNFTGVDSVGFPEGVSIFFNSSLINYVGHVTNSTSNTIATFSSGGDSVIGDQEGLVLVDYILLPSNANVTNAIMNITGEQADEGQYASHFSGDDYVSGDIFGITIWKNNVWTYESGVNKVNEYTTSGSLTGNTLSTNYGEGITNNVSHMFKRDSSTSIIVYDSNLNVDDSWNITDLSHPKGLGHNGSHIFAINYSGEVHYYDYDGTHNGYLFNATSELTLGSGTGITSVGDYFYVTGIFGDVYKYNSTGAYLGLTFNPVIDGESSTSDSLYGLATDDVYLWGGREDDKIISYYVSYYPEDVFVEIGTMDGTREYNKSGTLTTTEPILNFSTAINTYLTSCTPDANGDCNIPIYVYSSKFGKVTLNELSVTYDLVINPISLNLTNIQSYLDGLVLDPSGDQDNVLAIFDSSANYYSLGGSGENEFCRKAQFNASNGTAWIKITGTVSRNNVGSNLIYNIREVNTSSSPNNVSTVLATCDPEDPTSGTPINKSCYVSMDVVQNTNYWFCAAAEGGSTGTTYYQIYRDNTILSDNSNAYYSTSSSAWDVNTNLRSQVMIINFTGMTDASIELVVVNSGGGNINITGLKRNYRGGNSTIEIKAHNTNYSVNTSLNTTHFYSRWGYSLPDGTDYFEFIPSNPTSTQVTPNGQLTTVPFLNITPKNYGGNSNISIITNETFSCVNLTSSNDNNYSAGIMLNTSWQDLQTNINSVSSVGVWFWADYNCNFSTWTTWQPTLNLRACCTTCYCGEEVLN